MFSVHSVTHRHCVPYSSFCVTHGCWGLDSCKIRSIVVVCYIFVMCRTSCCAGVSKSCVVLRVVVVRRTDVLHVVPVVLSCH